MSLKHFIKEYSWLVILIAIILSFLFPKIGLTFKPYLIYLLMILMFFSCLNIRLKEIFFNLKDYKKKLLILLIIHLVSPLLVLFLKPFLSDELFLGFILASVTSSGMSVVFLSHLYKGIESEALVITSLSNIFSPVIIPLLVFLFAKTSVQVDSFAMSMTILKLVIIPLSLALLIRKTKLNKSISHYGIYISIFILFLLILGIISPVRNIILLNIKQSLIIGVIISVLVIFNFLLGYFIGSSRPEKITFAISGSYKNFTLATVLALSLFNPIVALPAILYTIVNNLFLIPMQFFFIKEKNHPE